VAAFTERRSTICKNKRAQGGTTDPWLKTGASQMVTDVRSLPTARCSSLIPTTPRHRHLDYGTDKLKSMAIERDKAGFQLNFHAIGDRANRVTL